MKYALKYLFASSIIALTLTFSSYATTVKLSDYTTPNDGLDDSVGFQAAIDLLKSSGGGTIIVDGGTWDFWSQLNFTTSGNYISYRVQGDKGAIIRPHLGPWNVLFYPGNTNQFELADLVVAGDPNADYDAFFIVGGGYTSQMKITGCQFFGLHVQDSVVYIGAAMEAVLESNMFGGDAADVAVVHSVDSRGFTVRNAEFIDYANFLNTYLSKTPNNLGPWIKAETAGGVLTPNANGQRVIRLEDIRLDEGAPQAIVISNASNVMISGLMVNVSGIDAGMGVVLDRVGYAEIKMSRFGYTKNMRPAVIVKNESNVFLNGITLGGGVYIGNADRTSNVVFDSRLCGTCSMKPISPLIFYGGKEGGDIPRPVQTLRPRKDE